MSHDKNNVYALNLKGDVVHASEADSGRQGYYCLGCKNEMQAVRHNKSNRIDYFRHDSKNVASQSDCTYSDETYRHKLAKAILQRIKRIKVPAVYKFPPKNQEGLPNRLEESKYIEAANVKIETTFYEDESGNIHFGSNKEVDARFLMVRPDVIFFNSHIEPILFIEIVVTHGIKREKLIKLKRLGIDTVQISVPKDSPENIENNFHVVENIKWVYNNVEERAEYIRVPSTDSKGVLQIDELQRKLHEESFSCRAAEIGNLIRAINRCMESKQYKESESELREKISRLTRITGDYSARLVKIREECRNRANSTHATEYGTISERRVRVERAKETITRDHNDLESRYYKKAREIDKEERELEFRERRILLGESEERTKHHHRTAEHIQRIIKAEAMLVDREREEEQRLKTEEETLPGIFKQTEDELRSRFEELRVRAFNSVKTRNGDGNDELSKGIGHIIQTRSRLEMDYETYKRYREAWDSFNNGTYKNWTD